MDLYQYLEFREFLEQNDGNINEFLQLTPSEKEKYLERIDEGWNEFFGFFIKLFGHFLGGKRTLLGKFLKTSGIRKKQISYLGRQKKKFVKDLLGPEAAKNALNDEEKLITYQSIQENKEGLVQKTLRGFVNRKYEIYNKFGVEEIDELDEAQIKDIRDIEKKITNHIDESIDKLYNLKTKQIHKKIEGLNIKDYQKYALKYLWEKMIIALKPRIMSDLLEQNVIESKEVKQQVESLNRETQKNTENWLKKTTQNIQNKFKGAGKEEVQEGDIWNIKIEGTTKKVKIWEVTRKEVYFDDVVTDETYDMPIKKFKEQGERYEKSEEETEESKEKRKVQPKIGEHWEYEAESGKKYIVKINDVSDELVVATDLNSGKESSMKKNTFLSRSKKVKRGGEEYEERL